MIRVILINLALFCLPFVLYGAYLYFVRGKENGEAIINEAPLGWLFGTGAILVVVTLLNLISFTGEKPGRVYIPPKVEDGKIIPGHFEDTPPKTAQTPATSSKTSGAK